MTSIKVLISKLEADIAALERGGEPSQVSAADLDELSRIEDAAQGQFWELPLDEMERAAAIRDVFKAQYSQLPPAELEARIQEARQAKDLIRLFLYRDMTTSNSLRLLASRLPADEEILQQAQHARMLQRRIDELRTIPAWQRAPKQSPAEPKPQQLSDRAKEHYQQLISSGAYI
jgi:hypothetical protein